MNIQSAKLIISHHGNVALTRKSYETNKKDFDDFIKKYGGEIKEFSDNKDIIVINCENYVMPINEKRRTFEKLKKKKEDGILTEKQLEEMRKKCIKRNKKNTEAYSKVLKEQEKCRKKQ